MIAPFSRPLDSLSKADLLRLVEEEHPEGEALELKESLPGRGGPEAWLQGDGAITDGARNGLLAEVIAFANTHGGHVVLGIKESEDHPKRAAALKPLPRCAQLADRIRLQAQIRSSLSYRGWALSAWLPKLMEAG